MKKYILFSAIGVSLVTACNDDDNNNRNNNQDRVEVQNINRNGAVETALTTQHLNDSLDVLITTHKVWKNNDMVNEFSHRDTVPALGEAVLKAADAGGNETRAQGKKDYEFYITVK
jgi:hypothetical protein